MKITIELDDSDIHNISWTNPPQRLKTDRHNNHEEYGLTIEPGSYYWEKQKNPNYDPLNDNKDVCANCPNKPGGPNNKSGFCMCALPSVFGPNRITC